MQSNNFKVYIDYAHTPDALKKVLVNLTKKNKNQIYYLDVEVKEIKKKEVKWE